MALIVGHADFVIIAAIFIVIPFELTYREVEILKGNKIRTPFFIQGLMLIKLFTFVIYEIS